MKTKINTILAKTSSFAEVQAIAMKAYPKTTFWGKRSICVKGFENSLTIDSLAAKTIELLKQNLEYDIDEREALKILSKRINKLYKLSDKDLRHKNFLTRLFAWARDACTSDGFYDTRFYWETEYCDAFEDYTKSQYIEAFGKNPPDHPFWTILNKWTVPSK